MQILDSGPEWTLLYGLQLYEALKQPIQLVSAFRNMAFGYSIANIDIEDPYLFLFLSLVSQLVPPNSHHHQNVYTLRIINESIRKHKICF